MPVVAVSSETLNALPDKVVWVAANITNQSELSGAKIYYQWQKQTEKGGWADVSGETENTLTFRYPNADAAGIYRCKVSALADQNLVTAYSPEVTVAYAQREAEITSLTLDQKTGKLTATVKGVGVDTIPAGTVSFKLGSGSTESVYTANLDAKGTATVTVNPANGVYKVTADYSGSKVFLPASYEPETPQFYAKGITADRYYVDVKDTYTYGDTLRFIKYTVDASGSITACEESYNSGNWRFPSDLEANSNFTSIQKRFQDNRAGWATKAAMLEENSTSRMAGITVERKDAEITELTDWTVSAGEVDTVDKRSALYAKIKSTLKMEGLVSGWDDTPIFSIVPTDTAGNYASSIAKPGVYTITVALYNPSTSITQNYNYTLPTAKLIVTGDTYPVSAAVESGETAYGSVSVSSPAGAAQAAAGQTVIFRAVPNDGYEVAGWTLNGTAVENSAGQTTLTVVQTKAGADAVVSFRTKQNTLTVTALPASPTVGGAAVENTVKADSTYFQSGNPYSTGAEITFTPEAAGGWHFTGWEYHVSGQSPQYSSDETFTVTMPDSSVQLYAKFERDTYRLTFGEHLTAYADGKPITDLDAITGDTEVTVKPATGYALAENAQWQVNGEEYTAEEDGFCKFSVAADTSVTAEVAAQKYTVTLNTVSPADSGTAEATQTGEVTGGTEVTFTAAPSRGCAFDKWTDENGKTVSTNASYTVTVGANITLTPVFTAQTGKPVSISAENGGGISWSIDGVDSSEYEDTITLYPGETLKITATPNDGKMVAGWNVNSSYDGNDYSREKTFDYKDLSDSNTIFVSFKALTYFTVAFADGIEAKADGEPVTSGASVAAGSRMTFTYSNNADTSVRVIKWKNGDTECPLAEQLVIDSLKSALDISVETGELSFFSVDVEGENFTHNITGIYEENGSYAAGSSVTIKLTPETDFRITEVNCPGADISQDEDSGIWTAVIERLDGNVTCKVTTESTAAPPAVTKFTVTFDADGGSVSPETMETDENGKLSELPTPTRSGYRFDGWFTAAGEKADENTAYPENTTLTAHWTKQESGGTGGGSSGGGGSSSGGSSGGGSTGGGTTTPVTPDPGTTAPENPTDNPSRESIAFTDIEGHWAKEYIDYASAHGLVSGTSSTTFSPDAPTTRAQLWTMLARQAGADLAGGETWYEKAQIWAKNSGVSDGSDPDGVITRAQMVTMLYRAAGSPEITGGSSFTDVPADSWYAKAVAWAAAKGITTGTGNGRFSPNEPCTRAQIAAFLYRSSRNS